MILEQKEGNKVAEIGEDDFLEEVLQSDLPVVVDFFSTWCPPCLPMSEIIDKLAVEYKGKVRFYKVDSEKNTELVDKLKVKSVPTLLFFRNNDVQAQVGLAPEEKIRSKIEAHLTRGSER